MLTMDQLGINCVKHIVTMHQGNIAATNYSLSSGMQDRKRPEKQFECQSECCKQQAVHLVDCMPNMRGNLSQSQVHRIHEMSGLSQLRTTEFSLNRV